MAYEMYGALQESERRRVGGQYSALREELQTGIHARGIGRSGFAVDENVKLDTSETGAYGEVAAGTTDRLMQYRQQQEELLMQQRMADAMARAGKKAKKKRRKAGWIGAALGVAGLALAIPTGGASLALTGAGAAMMAQ